MPINSYAPDPDTQYTASLYWSKAMSDHVVPVTHDLLVRELSSVVQWDVLGIYLGLEETEIETIERDHHDTARRRIVMLRKWMEKDLNASWEKVIDSLESMSLVRLANQLKKKYCPESESMPPVTTAKLVAKKDMMMKRQESIAQGIEELEVKYLLLITGIHSAMVEANPSLIKLQMFSKFYTKIEVTTVKELMDLLEPFCFLDYALLEKIVEFFLKQHTVADDLRDYLQQLDKFKSSTTVEQFMESIKQAQQSDSTTSECTVTLRLVGGWLEKTMDDLERLVKEIFNDKTYVLSHLKIVRGSIVLTYSAPQSEAETLIMLALEQSSFMTKVGVIELIVGETMVAQNNSQDYSFETSLLGAIKEGDLNLVRFLLKINTSADAANERGITALMHAIYYNRNDALSLLMKANANPNIQESKGATALYLASQVGHTGAVSLLLKANANPKLQCYDGSTALFIASQQGHADVVSLLLKANVNPDCQKGDDSAPLLIAIQSGHTEIVSLLLSANANANIRINDGPTPLYIASQNCLIDTIALLLKANANPNCQTKDGTTPLFIASQKGHTDAVSLLLNAKANPDLHRENNIVPLYIASQNGHIKIVSLLLKANANPNIPMDDGLSPLYIACQEGHTEIVSLLLKANADPNSQSESGMTPLYIASQQGHASVVDLLIQFNAKTSIHRKEKSATPLYTASQNGHSEVVSILLKANADPNQQIDDKVTALMIASLNGHSRVVQLLLSNGADPNTQAVDNSTALMTACHCGSFDSVELLLNFGADPSIAGPQGATALDVAANLNHKDIVDLIKTMELSKSSTTSQPVLTINEIASKVDNETMALINRAMEQKLKLVKNTHAFINAEFKKVNKILPIIKHSEGLSNILPSTPTLVS